MNNSPSIFRLDGKTAVITGAGSGIGQAIACLFAEAGAIVYVLDRDATGGAATVEQIKSTGGRATFIETDISRRDQCLAAAKQIGDAHVLVNNAGIGHVGTVLTTTEQDLDRLMSVNVKGV